MNETLFATNQLGNRYPVEQIKRVEIIRGPGSAIYGGFAEYGVINIITKQGEDLKGSEISTIYGQTDRDFARRAGSVMIGDKQGDLQYSFGAFYGQGKRSDRYYVDTAGKSANMNFGSALDPTFVNGFIGYKGLSFRCIADLMHTTMRDGYGAIVPGAPVPEDHNSVLSELKYVHKFGNELALTSRVNYKRQAPWKTGDYYGKDAYDRLAERTLGHIDVSYNVGRYLNFVAGTEAYYDNAHDRVDSSYFSNGAKNVNYSNIAVFGQGVVKTRLVNIVAGARYDHHSAFGDAFVPRVGFTKKYKKLHYKLLYSGAFRAPSIENINFSTDAGIRPELTTVAELETGYQFSRTSLVTLNVYDISTRNPIVYFTDSLNNDLYINSGHSGTQGIELEYRLKSRMLQLILNYSYYTAVNKERIEDYAVEEDRSALLAFANHRLNCALMWNVNDRLTISPSANFFGPRWGYATADSSGETVLERFDPVTLVNIFCAYKFKGLTIGAGIHNLLNQEYNFIQPYNGGHAPLPSLSREYSIRIQYNFRFKPRTK